MSTEKTYIADLPMTYPFEVALHLLKDGKKVTRKNWDSPDCFLAINHYGKDVPVADLWTEPIKSHLQGKGIETAHVEGSIMMLAWGNKICTWMPTPTDLLADDWQLVK